MIANAFGVYSNDERFVIFASGVSDSRNTDKNLFLREKNLLSDTIYKNSDKIFVYFSTCSVNDRSSRFEPYAVHKLEMEDIIKKECHYFYIFRLPQVAGVTTSPTFVRFMFESIQKNKKFKLNRYSSRNLILTEDVFEVTDHILKNEKYTNEVTNIASSESSMVLNIVSKIEAICEKKANYSFANNGSIQKIDITKLIELNENFDILQEGYLDKVLSKYYTHYYRS